MSDRDGVTAREVAALNAFAFASEKASVGPPAEEPNGGDSVATEKEYALAAGQALPSPNGNGVGTPADSQDTTPAVVGQDDGWESLVSPARGAIDGTKDGFKGVQSGCLEANCRGCAVM